MKRNDRSALKSRILAATLFSFHRHFLISEVENKVDKERKHKNQTERHRLNLQLQIRRVE